MNIKDKKLEFYTDAYNQMKKLEELYENYFSLDKIKVDIVKSRIGKTKDELEKEYNELVALETMILSTMIGLNKEKLEFANSQLSEKNLFQYKDYESSMKIYFSPTYYEDGFETSKNLSKELNFNPSEEGPFPYMLEIIKDDNKNRPYDYVSKIRNALLHAEFYLESPEILHIQNHNDNGELTFEGRLSVFSFAMFVIDFFGINGVNDLFPLYNQLNMEEFKDEHDIIKFLYDFKALNIKFTKIPNSYKYQGKDALFARLNNCFGLDSSETKDIVEELEKLNEEDFKFNVTEHSLSKLSIANMYRYILRRYNNIFNNSEVVKHVSALAKLQINPHPEITNCLGNMLTYISYKKEYLMHGKIISKDLFDELKYDEYCDTAFKYALSILKSNIINYAIECEEFENIDFKNIDTAEIFIADKNELRRRTQSYVIEGMKESEAQNKVVIETVRNALAHGGERLKVNIEPQLTIDLTDIYHNVTPLRLITTLKDMNNVLDNYEFKPENIKTKENSKTKVKK